ncbi:sugar phosphate isomerase/epimerase [bacterium]|nr:sugar phosphate isomerase/epimerase [bacterium]
MGYIGVETAGFPGTTPENAAKLFKELELEVPSAHTAMPIGESKQETLDVMYALDSKRIVSGLGPENFLTTDLVKKSCEKINEASAVAVENGLSFVYHNHWWEFLTVNNRSVYKIMLDYLVPEVLFELDTYWVKTAGLNPTAVIRELGKRIPLLHVKDGSCKKDEAMTAVGDGIMDFNSIVEAGKTTVEWMIVELDRCDTDMMEAVKKSYVYLTSNKLANGKL